MDDKEKRKSYTSKLREQQKEQTRNLILESLASLVMEGKIHNFSVQEVADRAGISYGAVYKHFSSREEMLESLYDWGQMKFSKSFPLSPRNLDDLVNAQQNYVNESEEDFIVSAAVIRTLAALDIVPQAMLDRDEKAIHMLQHELPELDKVYTKQAAGVIRLISSSQFWVTLRTRFNFSAQDSADALTWVLDTLVRDLKNKNKQLKEEK